MTSQRYRQLLHGLRNIKQPEILLQHVLEPSDVTEVFEKELVITLFIQDQIL